MRFINDEGTEDGGLIFGGSGGVERKPDSLSHLSFDQYEQDPTVVLGTALHDGIRTEGIQLNDAPLAPITPDLISEAVRIKNPASPPAAPRPSNFAVIQTRAQVSYIDLLARYALDVPAGLKIPVAISVAGLVLAAFMDMPYDFYILLRVLVCLTCVIVAVPLWRSEMAGAWFWAAVGIAVLYNRLLPVHLHKGTWEWLNIATIPVFAALFLIIKPRTFV